MEAFFPISIVPNPLFMPPVLLWQEECIGNLLLSTALSHQSLVISCKFAHRVCRDFSLFSEVSGMVNWMLNYPSCFSFSFISFFLSIVLMWLIYYLILVNTTPNHHLNKKKNWKTRLVLSKYVTNAIVGRFLCSACTDICCNLWSKNSEL